ncbi:MAG: isochorismatase family protein [Deltaproteobacteria bacterium]|nr:isochorismatase family protein [Deltaproteobacteria bacterium]
MKHTIDSAYVPGDGDALVIVDVQNDFVPGGALAVPEGDQVVAPLNKAIKIFQTRNLPVFLTRDWHPDKHCSFKEFGGLWPPHCVQNTRGAEFVSDLQVNDRSTTITKGVAFEPDEYSGFQGVDEKGTSLDMCLKNLGVVRIFVGGLATDYCVLSTVLDGLSLKYDVFIFTDGVRAVNVKPDDGEMSLKEMTQNGARLTTTESLGA